MRAKGREIMTSKEDQIKGSYPGPTYLSVFRPVEGISGATLPSVVLSIEGLLFSFLYHSLRLSWTCKWLELGST